MTARLILRCGLTAAALFAVAVSAAKAQEWRALRDSGYARLKQGDQEGALGFWEHCVPLIEAAEGDTSAALERMSNSIGSMCMSKQRYAEAVPHLRRVLRIRSRISASPVDRAGSMNTLGLACFYLGLYGEAEPLFREALKIVRDRSVTHMTALLAGNLALLLQETGRYTEAELLHREVLQIDEKLWGLKSRIVATDLNNMGLLAFTLGRYVEADSIYASAESIGREVWGENDTEYATTLNNIAVLSASLGRKEEAEKLYRRALEIRISTFGENHADVAQSLNNLAALLAASDSVDEAVSIQRRAVRVSMTAFGRDHVSYAHALNNLARILQNRGDADEADTLFLTAARIRAEKLGKTHPDYAQSLHNLGALRLARGRYAEAEAFLREALKIRAENLREENLDRIESNSLLASMLDAAGRPGEAAAHFSTAVRGARKLLQTVYPFLSEQDKLSAALRVGDVFERFQSFVADRSSGRPELLPLLADLLLASKGEILAASKARSHVPRQDDPRADSLRRTWRIQREQLARLYSLPAAAVKRSGLSIDSLQQTVNRLERNLARIATKDAAEPVPVSFEELRRLLRPGEAYVDLVRFRRYRGRWTDSIVYGALVYCSKTRPIPSLVLLDDGDELEKRWFRAFRHHITLPMAALKESLEQASRIKDSGRLSGILYDRYWARISAALNGVKRVYLSPDGVYHLVNISALRNPRSGLHFIDEFDLRVITSASELRKTAEGRRAGKRTAVLIGDPAYDMSQSGMRNLAMRLFPMAQLDEDDAGIRGGLSRLPGTRDEVRVIGDLLRKKGWSARIFLGDSAVESAVKSAGAPYVLHIATHGYFLPATGSAGLNDRGSSVHRALFRSGLLLSGASSNVMEEAGQNGGLRGNENGILTAFEVGHLDFRGTALVVLSACRSGVGDVRNGEGVYGLRRAFTLAGAGSVVMSLWNVSDEATREMMEGFYRHWLQSADAHSALRRAQLELRRRFPHPFFWAAFIVTGA